MIIEISVAIIAVAFVALVIYIIAFTKALKITLGQVNQTLVEVRKQLDEVGGEAKKTIEQTHEVSVDLKNKMAALNSVFSTVANIGDILEQKSFLFKREIISSSDEESLRVAVHASKTKEGPSARELFKVADILELAGMGIRLWQKLKKRGDKQ